MSCRQFCAQLTLYSLLLVFFSLEIKDDSKVKIIKEGPVPWCKSDQLTFVSEQVSHHPPSNTRHYSFVQIDKAHKKI